MGYVLALFVLVDTASWLWAWTFPENLGLLALSFVGGVALIVLWLAYLAVWFRRVRRFTWQLLIIPVIGLCAVALRLTNAVPDARWAYDEPRLRAAAEQVLTDPRAEFYDNRDRSIGTQEVYATSKEDGVVRFSIYGNTISTTRLAYHPEGATPTDATRTRVTHLAGRWWMETSSD
ncbi:Uncharacterised protein [Tsukamurella paurometabola]|uniref:Uncharacterized protein n=1 Tax=Tsukamurella paurometabola TaxID=2061 RepID=A0A3P8L0X1_TSUPA|nr:Uncharacterised protein [Tsukamurella paurometabola]